MQEDELTEEYVLEDDLKTPENSGWKGRIIKFLESRYFSVVCIILIGIVSFSLGRISGLEEKREPVRVISEEKGQVLGATKDKTSLSVPLSLTKREEIEQTPGQVVASKNGTKYHYPWCGGAKQISEKNKIFFNSIEEARKAGYTPASNCKGLK